MKTEDQQKAEVRKLILEEMTLFAQEHRAEIIRRAMAKWKERQQDKQQESMDGNEPEFSELA